MDQMRTTGTWKNQRDGFSLQQERGLWLVFIVSKYFGLLQQRQRGEEDQATCFVGHEIIPYPESGIGMIVLLKTPIKYQWSILSQ